MQCFWLGLSESPKALHPQRLLVIMTASKNNQNQSQLEQAIVRPAAAAWGLRLLKVLGLEKFLRLGDR